MKVTIYTTSYCGFCRAAVAYLVKCNIDFEEISLDGNPDLRKQISVENSGYSTVPMVFVGQEFIGGYTELVAYEFSGVL